MRRLMTFLITHGIAGVIGFAFGLYSLPILTAPASPDETMLEERAASALYSTELTRELRGSDFLHWGEGTISVTPTQIIHEGRLAPGPDYTLYLAREFIEHEDEFDRQLVQLVGEVKGFKGFLLDVPDGVDIEDYNTVLIWCESFGEFITAAKFK